MYPAGAAEAVPALSTDLAKLLVPLPTKNIQTQVASIQAAGNHTLARLDEFQALIEAVRINQSKAEADLIPRLQQRAANLQVLFQRIDKFQEYLAELEVSVTKMEQRYEEVAEYHDSESGIITVSKLFKSIVSRVKGPDATNTKKKKPEFTPVGFIVKTSDHFV